jgi:hypothetical protein
MVNMSEFAVLDSQVNDLVTIVERRRGENLALSQKLNHLTKDRVHLRERNKVTVLKVKQVMNQLQEELL